MINPWLHLPTAPPYVLAGDAAAVGRFNPQTTDLHRLHLDLLPEPYIGDPRTAAVLLLNLNPGFSMNDYVFYARPEAAAASLANLVHGATAYPYYFLDPRLRDPAHPSGPEWWLRKLRWLIESCGLEAVANRLACVELFPYHSRRYHPLGSTLPSQRYGFDLVRQAVERGAIVVLMRARQHWLQAVPALAAYPVVELKNRQNVSLSPNNLPAGQFDALVSHLRA